jgi:hypothetical protein
MKIVPKLLKILSHQHPTLLLGRLPNEAPLSNKIAILSRQLKLDHMNFPEQCSTQFSVFEILDQFSSDR